MPVMLLDLGLDGLIIGGGNVVDKLHGFLVHTQDLDLLGDELHALGVLLGRLFASQKLLP